MIEIYGWKAGNTYRVLLALEEAELPYSLLPVDISQGDQNKPEFVKLNPMAQVPVIRDDLGPGGKTVVITQSAAILQYLAEKSGTLLPAGAHDRIAANEALQLVMSDLVAPVNFCFNLERATQNSSATEFGKQRAQQALKAIEKRLENAPFITGQIFGIADCAAFPMVKMLGEEQIRELPKLTSWFSEASERASVKRTLSVTFD